MHKRFKTARKAWAVSEQDALREADQARLEVKQAVERAKGQRKRDEKRSPSHDV